MDSPLPLWLNWKPAHRNHVSANGKEAAMLAYRLLQAQTQPEFQEVPEPHPGPGQVVVRVAGSGLYHTTADTPLVGIQTKA